MINGIFPLPVTSPVLAPATTPKVVSKASGATVWLPAILAAYALGY